MLRSGTRARPGQDGRETGASPTCADCLFLNRRCPHVHSLQFGDGVRHEVHKHSRSSDDDSCFRFLLRQVRWETAAAPETAIVTHDGLSGLSYPYLAEFVERASRVARARSGSLRATLTHRVEELAESRYPALASVISEALRTGPQDPTREWLRLALTDEPIEIVCARSHQDETNVRRAINSTAHRVCRNELPLRLRDDLAAIAP